MDDPRVLAKQAGAQLATDEGTDWVDSDVEDAWPDYAEDIMSELGQYFLAGYHEAVASSHRVRRIRRVTAARRRELR
jgi:hypothetical protein